MWAKIKDGFLFGVGLWMAQALVGWIASLGIEILSHVARAR